ncbi:T9SS type A sorting domain-containing protein [Terrimonas sp. NA20]|uniref:T9SS type A sorting domain-containing protein n=1 Tax=Terrimonas ginsenosidimutans TaxID=2908004 RepID=A0ABS9KSP6_9BACT|nr:T9SS type A sorting domain-containing protein [Terrimonas ginsenosidimutans]MCG2615352.1 T9SS type A sorting domain-containing protein [Terrimonas ginsenosidimutans]
MRKFLLFFLLPFCASAVSGQTTFTWNGSVSSDWSAPANWTPAGVPTSTDNVIIVNTANSCRLNGDVSVNNLTLTSGTFNLSGFAITVNGTNFTCTAGTIQPGKLVVAGANNVSFGNGPLVFNCKTSITAATMIVRNTRFEDSVYLHKTGTTGDGNHGNNIFNAPLNVLCSGSGTLMLGTSMADQFNAPSVFTNTGVGNLYVASGASGHVFNAPVTFNNMASSSSAIYVSNTSTSTIFNADITVNNTGQGIFFCHGNSSAQATLAAGYRILIGTDGFSAGSLSLRQFNQSGATPQNITLTSTATLRFGPLSTFDGNITSSSPGLLLNGATFNGVTSFLKTGANGDWSSGGNTFNGQCSITNSGESFLVLGNYASDVWNEDVTFTANGADRILPGWRGQTWFNGNIFLNSNDTARGIQFCGGDTSARTYLAAGKTIREGATGITSGYVYLRQFFQQGNTPVVITATVNGSVYLGPNSDFEAPVTITAPNIYAQGAIYHAPVRFVKTGGGGNANNGYQNIFESTCEIDQQSNTGYFTLGHRSNDLFKDDIIVNNSGTASIYLGNNAYGSAPELAAGKTIRVGATGFSAGYLYLKHFIQQGNEPIRLDFTGTAALAISDTSIIGGDLITNTPGIYFNGGVFRSKVNSVKTGTNSDYSNGGNIFNGDVSLLNSGTGYLILGGSRPDSFFARSSFHSDGTSYVGLGWNTAGTYFGDDIVVASTGSSRGIYFTNNAVTSSATLKAGHSISVQLDSFIIGSLAIRRFTQEGNAPVTLNMSGTSQLTVGPGVLLGGDITVSAPGFYLNGAEYSGTTDFTKTGASSESSEGGNIFRGVSRIRNSGAGYYLLGDRYADTWYDDAHFTTAGTERALVAWSTPGNMFNGNVYVNSTGTATGVRFCGGNTTATATIAAGKTLAVGADGFTSGYLQLRQFTKLGSAPINLSFASTASYVQYGPSSVFDGDVTSSTPGLFVHSSTFNGKVNFTKTGANTDYSNGGNIFNDETVITNAGSSSIVFGQNAPDLFNATTTFNNTGTANMHMANNSTGNTFKGVTYINNLPLNNSAIYISGNSPSTVFDNNVLVTSINGGGIEFCGNSIASATLTAGHTIRVGSAGFTAGRLLLRQFTQVGTTAQSLTLAGGTLAFGPSSLFGGEIVTNSSALTLNSTVFESAASFTKTGASNDNCAGSNIFQSTSSFTTTGTGNLALAYTNPDRHVGDATFIQLSTGRMYPNYNANVDYLGNVNVTSSSGLAITFGAGNGTASFTGTGAQAFNVTAGSAVPVISRMVLDNTAAGLTLNSNVNISRTLALSRGLLHTTSAAILTMLNNSTTTAGTALSTSYVDGPMRYQKSASGSTILNFPIGGGGYSRPVVLTVNHTNGALYTYQAQMHNSSARALNYTLPFSVSNVSERRYYTIDRYNSSMVNQPTADLSGNQFIEIFFGEQDVVKDGSKVTIVKNLHTAPTSWINIGGAGGPAYDAGNNLTGSLRSTSSPSAFNSFSTFALGNIVGGMNPLPATIVDFQAVSAGNNVLLNWATASEQNNSYFTIERSADGTSFHGLKQVTSLAAGGNSSVTLNYGSIDATPLSGVSYYRLKQTDRNGQSTYGKQVKVDRRQDGSLSFYPNPASKQIRFNGFALNEQKASIEWWDMGGRSVLKGTLSVAGGSAMMNINLPDGVYITRITLADGTIFLRQVMIRN